MNPDTSNPKFIKNKKRREKRAVERRMNDIRTVMATPEGRRLLVRILAMSQMFNNVFEGSNEWNAFRSGLRNIGVELFADIVDACPEKYLEAVAEAKAHQEIEATLDAALIEVQPPEEGEIDG